MYMHTQTKRRTHMNIRQKRNYRNKWYQVVQKGEHNDAPPPILCTQAGPDIYNIAPCMCVYCTCEYFQTKRPKTISTSADFMYADQYRYI